MPESAAQQSLSDTRIQGWVTAGEGVEYGRTASGIPAYPDLPGHRRRPDRGHAQRAFCFAKQNPDSEKLSPYECGFEAFDDARRQFDVRFYLVSILFIIFDLEVAFLFPWAVTLGEIGVFGFWSMMIFLGVLTVGFIYEWKKGRSNGSEHQSSATASGTCPGPGDSSGD